MPIQITRTNNPKTKPQGELGFGRYFTDHMFLMNYSREKGWHDARVTPYAPLQLDPASMVLHYGQEIFEGLKAYRRPDGGVQLFRPIENIRRFNRSNERLCVPQIDEDLFMEALLTLLRTDEDWVPKIPDASLYIRPFLIATDPFLGVRSSDTYLFLIILSPVGAYYPEGMSPIKILIESEDVRAVRGGIGFAKTGANYAATIRAQDRAKHKGFTQVLWLDALERRFIEEVGTSNVFFKISGEIVTPPLEGSILPGITRKSCIELLRSWNIPVSERRISVDELFETAQSGALEESFGSGTAAVVSPVGLFHIDGRDIVVADGQTGPVTRRLYETLTDIQWGRAADPYGWTVSL